MPSYVLLQSISLRAVSATEHEYLSYIGHKFRDTEEDCACFEIVDVVDRVNDSNVFFQYRPIIEEGDCCKEDEEKEKVTSKTLKQPRQRSKYEYTPCEEVLAATWVQWLEVII